MRFSDDTREVRHPRLRQFVLCWECFTKTFPLPLISLVWDLRRGLVDFCLKKRYFSEAKPSCCSSVIFSILMLDFWQICLCYLTQRFFFSISLWQQGTHSPQPSMLLPLCSAQQIKCLSRKFDWDFVWPLNWADGARAWLSANTASNGLLESASSIDLPVTFTRLA